MDQISDLILFARIVDAGSLSEAGRRMNSSAPAMSRRLAGLEERLGVRLVDRSSRRFTPTDEGAALYERALRIMADVEEAEAEARSRIRTPSGNLRIGAPMEIGRRRVAGLIADFSDQYPRVACELVLSDAGLELGRDGLDIALRTTSPTEPGVHTAQILKGRRIVCAAPSYLIQHGTPQHPNDLVNHDCIRLVRSYQTIDNWGFAEPGKPFEVQVKGRLSTTSAEVIHGWVLEGRGIAVKASWDIAADLREGRLIECLAGYSRREMYLNAVAPKTEPLASRVKVFLDYARRLVPEEDDTKALPVMAD